MSVDAAMECYAYYRESVESGLIHRSKYIVAVKTTETGYHGGETSNSAASH